MGRIKPLLFYAAFWVLGTILSAAVFASYTAYDIMQVMVLLGEADPQLVAGQISVEILAWLFVVIIISLIGYPLHSFLKNRSRFRGITCFLVLSIVAHFAYQFTQEYFIENGLVLGSLAGVAIFVFVSISIPSWLRQRKLRNLALEQTTNTFD